MQRTADADSFCLEPMGQYIVGSTYLVWCWDETLCGSVVWGRPTDVEARELIRFYELDRTARLAPTFDVVTDASRMETVTPSAFPVVFGFLARRLPSLAPRMRKNAIVLAPGITGAIIAGMYPLLGGTNHWKPFTDGAAAFRWLDRPHAVEAGAEVERLVAEATSGSSVVGALRAYLRDHLGGASLVEAARALALSPRSLQRQLAQASTSLRAELDSVRLEEATRRLVDEDAKLETIAQELGFASPSHFASRFRQLTGVTPSDYRARHR